MALRQRREHCNTGGSRDAGDGTGGEVARTSRRTPRATIHDVARLAGVTIGTASKALNGGGNLRADTRERVRKAAKNLDYRPNDLAQSLHRKQSFTVGMLSNDSFGRFTLPIFEFGPLSALHIVAGAQVMSRYL
jgi:LacI family transcriptional regulator